jgi:hypothetical protein
MIWRKTDFCGWFLQQNKLMRVLAAGQLVLLGVAVVIVVGS